MLVFWLSIVSIVAQAIVAVGTLFLWKKNDKIRGVTILSFSLIFWTLSILVFKHSNIESLISLTAVLIYVSGWLVPMGPVWIAIAYSKRFKKGFVKFNYYISQFPVYFLAFFSFIAKIG